MEPLFNQLRELPKRLASLPPSVKFGALAGLAVLAVIIAVTQLSGTSGAWEYAFTNLSAEDSAEAAAQMKAAKIPFKLDAGGTALSVPASQVYDVRLMLAAAGLPRGGGVGFEIFDRGDLGVSEFTQRVNLQRAIEGELARTISRLAPVRSARVHITLPEKGLYRDDDRKASAGVALTLQPGRAMSDREIAGVRHLVSSAVTGLSPEGVTIVDGRGSVLAGDSSPASKAQTAERDIEKSFERRIIDLLEPNLGTGAVVAKVSAVFDSSEVETTADAYDPEASAVRSEHHTNEQNSLDGPGPAGIAGAAANQPLAGPTPGGGSSKGASQREDETKNYEISKTVTHTITRGSRLKRMSVAVLLDAPGGKARSEAEMKRLEALAKGAVGFDAARGDQFQISSSAFNRADEPEAQKLSFLDSPRIMRIAQLVGGVVLLIIAALAISKMRALASSSSGTALAVNGGVAMLRPGARVGELEAMMSDNQRALPASSAGALSGAPVDPNVAIRDRARDVARTDPGRAAHLLKAWIESDSEQRS
jgi:flagellar M-ring protein FliF